MNQLDFWHADIDSRNTKVDLKIFRLGVIKNALCKSDFKILKSAISQE